MVCDLIIPALNEAANIGPLFDALSDKGIRPLYRRVVLADNGSTDATPILALHRGAVVVHEAQRGYGAACQRALRWIEYEAPDAPPDIVAFLDADLSDDPAALPALLAPFNEKLTAEARRTRSAVTDQRSEVSDRAAVGAPAAEPHPLAPPPPHPLTPPHSPRLRGESRPIDLVIGSRPRLAEPGALNLVQRFGNAFACLLMRLTIGARYSDLGPLRAIRWEALQRLDMVDRTWGWTVEMQMKAALIGLAAVEVDVPYRRRFRGRSKISGTLRGVAKAGARIFITIATLWWRHRRGKFRSSGH